MIFEMTRGGSKKVSGSARRIQPSFAEALVCVLVIRCEVQIPLSQRSARKRIITNSVAAHPGVCQRQRNQQQNYQDSRGKSRDYGFSWKYLVLPLNHLATRAGLRKGRGSSH